MRRRLAYRQDHRLTHHAASPPPGRLLGRDGRGNRDWPRYDRKGSHLDHPRHRRSCLRRWRNPRMARRALDLGREDRGRVGRYFPGRSPDRRRRIRFRPLRNRTIYSLELRVVSCRAALKSRTRDLLFQHFPLLTTKSLGAVQRKEIYVRLGFAEER
jgi:hypothetical protein